MNVLAIVSTLLLQQAQVPTPQEVAATLQGGRELVAIDGFGELVAVAPDGSAIAVVHHERKLACIIDAATGEMREAPLGGEVFSIALLPNGRGCWLGLEDGSVAHAPTDGELRRFDVVGQPVDGLLCVGGHVAWSSSKADLGGVLDARDGAVRFQAQVPFGGYRERRMFLSRDGRHALHFARDPEQGGRRVVVVRDVRSGEERGTASSYLSKREPGFALGLDRMFTAARVASSRWELRRFDLVTMKSRVVDADLRGKHFVDLMLSPSTRYLLEGDFEDRGAVLYDVGGEAPKRTLGQKGMVPVGFLGEAAFGEELVWTTAGPTRLGLTAWSSRTGAVIARDLPFAKGRRITRVGSLLGGRRMWVASWAVRKVRSIEYALQLVAFDK